MPSRSYTGGLVLIIDRDESIRRMLAAVLHRAGFTTHCVADGDAAAALGEERFDVIVREVNVLPREGRAALRDLERIAPELLRRTVITTTTPAALQKLAALARPFAVMRKPFDLELLVETVRRCRRDRATVSVDRVHQFVREMPRLHALLAEDGGSMRELLLRNEMRRTVLELAHVLDQAAQDERNRGRAAVFLGAALVAAQLAAPPRAATLHPTDRDH